MADGPGVSPPPDPRALARDWITIWHSEMAALATDREMQEFWLRMIGLWAQAAEAAAQVLPAGDFAHGRAGADAPAGAAATVAAPDARDAAIERLARRVEELERKLAQLG